MRVARLTTFVERYQHQLSVGSFFVGFALDTVLLKRIDLWASNALLITYLAIALAVLLILHSAAARPPRSVVRVRILEWLPFVAQFSFGGMFSGFLIFYSQAGTLSGSWPFLALIVVLIVCNEFMRSYQSRLTYQAALLFFCLYSFSIYAVPIFLGSMSDRIFELSGVVALVCFFGVYLLLRLIDVRRVRASAPSIAASVLGIYAVITTLYHTNFLPPIPLSLKDVGVYHDLERRGGVYSASAEPQSAWEQITGFTLSVVPGAELYAYSSVFAPTTLTTSIVHRWQRYEDDTWVTVASIPFSIIGGRDGGYRGYSAVPILAPGLWRVSVETVRGQRIGSQSFTVEFVSSPVATVSRILR